MYRLALVLALVALPMEVVCQTYEIGAGDLVAEADDDQVTWYRRN